MHIVHFSDAKFWGGNEQQLIVLLTSEVLNKEITQSLICLEGSPLYDTAKSLGLEINTISPYSKYSIKGAKEYGNLVKKINPDAIHIHNSGAVTRHYVSTLVTKLPHKVIFAKKGLSSSSTFMSRIKYNMPCIKKIICVSKDVVRGFSESIAPKNRENMVVVYDGIDVHFVADKNIESLKKKFDIPEDGIIIGNIANHTDAKDLPVLINLANELVNNQNRKDIYFMQIGGEKKQTPQLKEMAANFNLGKNFIFHGFCNDAKSIIEQFDIFVLTSKREGLPISIMEAMFAKCPVVTTRAGGIPEIIFDNETGKSADVGDYKTLAKHISYLLENPEEKQRIVDAAYQHVITDHSETKSNKDTLAVYKSVCQ